MKRYLMVDFGSTYTKLTAVDIEKKRLSQLQSHYTTVETDINEGYQNALECLYEKIGGKSF